MFYLKKHLHKLTNEVKEKIYIIPYSVFSNFAVFKQFCVLWQKVYVLHMNSYTRVFTPVIV